jgi:hypothetical protein
MVTVLWVKKLTMIATITTMVTGNEDNDGDGVTGNNPTGYNNDYDCDWQRRRRRR